MPTTGRRAVRKRATRRRGDQLAEVRRDLRTIPNIGRAMAEDLIRLGVRRVADLKKRDPVEMYLKISHLDGVRHDPCVLDTFMSAVAFAKTGRAVAWWRYTPERKRMVRAGVLG